MLAALEFRTPSSAFDVILGISPCLVPSYCISWTADWSLAEETACTLFPFLNSILNWLRVSNLRLGI